MAKIKCPNRRCRSTNCTPVATENRYKARKGLLNGALGALAFGHIGLLVGVASGANGKKKVKFVCGDCGQIFEVKL